MRNLKKILALALSLVMMLSVMSVASAKSLGEYNDASSVSAVYAEAVDVATQLGILKGMSETTYAPKGTLTRAQLATMIYRITTGDVAGNYIGNFAGGAATQFSDVSADAWYAGYVAYCADAGYLKGMGNGTYAPNATLTGYQALAALLRAIGYNQNNDFTGEDWTNRVAEVAYGSGIMTGVYASLADPLTREQAAQLIYNALLANKVSYTLAFGYNPNQPSLAASVFKIASVGTGRDMWNRPSTQWKTASGKVLVEIADEAIYKTNVAISQCDLASILGETSVYYVKTSTNGANFGAKTAFYATAGTKIGAQGTQVEVYYNATDDVYEIIVIETWLAKVASVTKATYDAVGHQKTASSTALTVSYPGGTTTWTVATEDYTKGSYVLVNYCEKAGDDYGAHIYSVAAPVAVAQLTAYTLATTTVGNTYVNAAKFALGAPVATSIGSYFNVYVDQYGNLIGLTAYAPETAYNFGIITDIAWQPSIGLADEYILANLLGVTNTPVTNVAIGNAWTNAGFSTGTFNASVGYNKASNSAYYDVLAQYYVDSYGQYVVAAWGKTLTGVTTSPVASYIVANGTTHYTVNADTVYLVKTVVAGQPVYTSYTGYASVPAMTGATGTYFADADNAYIAYVFIDATGASFPGASNLVMVLDNTADVIAANYQYNAWVGTDATTLTVSGQTALPGYTGAGLYAATYNVAGQVTAMTRVVWGVADAALGLNTTMLDVAFCNGQVMRNSTSTAAVSYGCSGMSVYLVNEAAKTVTAGTYEDTVGETVMLMLNALGTEVVAAYVVVG